MKITAIACLAAIALSGCANLTEDQKANASAAGKWLLGTAAQIGTSLLTKAVSSDDGLTKADYLDSVALGFRSGSQASMNTDAIRSLVGDYAPDKAHWVDFAVDLAKAYQDAQGSPDAKAELIAEGLNRAAAAQRSSALP